MHSIYLAGVPTFCIHVPATDPLCAGRHADLVTLSVITDHRFRWCASREPGRRMGTANHFRKRYRRCYEWNRASCNRDRRFVPSHPR